MFTPRRPWVIGICLASVAALIPSLSSAQTGQVVLNEGPWTGHMSLVGNAVGTIEGAPVDFRVDADGFFEIDIVGGITDDNELAGDETNFVAISGGMWNLNGSWQFETAIPGAGSAQVDASIAARGGFDGTPAAPIHTGVVDSVGSISTTAGGFERSIPLTSFGDPITLEVRLESSSCFEVYGDVTLTLTELIEQQGLDASFVGPWAAYRDTADISAAIEQWVSEMRGIGRVVGEPVEFPEDTPDVVRMFGELLAQYNTWADEINGTLGAEGDRETLWKRTADMVNDHAVFIARLRNLTECESAVLDPDLIEEFDTVIKRALLIQSQQLVRNAGLNIDKLTVLTDLNLFAGALGAAGPQPEAAETEEALRVATEAVLREGLILGSEDGTGIDGIDLENPDAIKALALAAKMKWTVSLNGTEYSADSVWERYEALPQNQAEGVAS